MAGTDVKITYGRVAEKEKTSFLALNWKSSNVEVDRDGIVAEPKLFRNVEGIGLYAFEGYHDAHPMPTVLYIGQANRDCGTLGARMKESFGWFWDGSTRSLYPDCFDLIVRWAHVDEEYKTRIDDAEALLILAHAPPFNKANARGWYQGDPDLVVLNGGAKGRLLPAAVGHSFAKEKWE